MKHTRTTFSIWHNSPAHGYLCMLGMKYMQPCKLTCNAGMHHRQHAPPQNRPHCASSVILAPSSDVAGLHDSAAHKLSSCRPPQQSQSLRPGYTKCTVCRGAHCTKAVAPSLYREAANAPTTSASTSSAGMKADAPRPISCSTHPALVRAYACIQRPVQQAGLGILPPPPVHKERVGRRQTACPHGSQVADAPQISHSPKNPEAALAAACHR